jgi:hypothetical protein
MPREEYVDDPTPGDENDPEYQEEMFDTFQSLGWKPEDLNEDDPWRELYRKWLEKQ